MTEVSYTPDELRALADSVELFEQIIDKLQKIEAWPRDAEIHIDSEIQPGHLGKIAYDEGGTIAFIPYHADTQKDEK